MMPSRKHKLKKYLISDCVPISTICKALGFIEPKKQLDTNGQAVEDICQKLLENIRLKIRVLEK